MRKYFLLTVFTLVLLALQHLLRDLVAFHPMFELLVIFFFIQNIIFFRIESFGGEDVRVQLSMVKIGLRLITSLVFILALSFIVKDALNQLIIQFIVLYFAYMIFEIFMALSNLRRN